MGRVYYPIDNQDGCKKYQRSHFKEEDLQGEGSHEQPIILIDRGGCTFVTKAQNAEKMGAKLAIIVDNVGERTDLV